jgi:tryptophanyl-tRNA synthetase
LNRYKKTFRLPEPYILKATGKITDLQDPTAKMSKSASSPSGIVEMLDDPKVSAKKIRSAVTDSGSEVRFDIEEKPGVSNLLTIYSALTGQPVVEIEEQYVGRGYGDLKKDLAEVVVDFVTPFRDRTLELLDDQAYLTDVLRQGAATAGAVAEATLRDVYQRVGFAAAAR